MMTSCVEEISLETESFESILVIEATITNENKQQEVLLSRSYMFDSIPVKETNATVRVMDDAANTYNFTETEPGVYKSQTAFAAQPNRNYNLSVVTSNGQEYGSNQKQLTQPTTIDNLYVERDFNENGIEGVSVYVDSYDPTGNSKYYRHEYEETFKIVAPLYSSEELIPNGIEFPILKDNTPVFLSNEELIDWLLTRQFRPEQEQICFKTEKSNTIIQANTTEFLEDKLDKYRVHFINRESTKIRERYSILVRQYVQSREAFVFYETLNNFSGSDSVFSEDHPGFLEGNVFSVQNDEDKVFGFFEVTSVDEKRIFFNYDDLFVNEPLPSYFLSCDEFYSPVLLKEDFAHNWIGSPLVDALNNGYQFYDVNSGSNTSPFSSAPFRLVLGPCGDCTFLGNNNTPDFWID
ncbi:MAG: DUF4249 domain-containing protein [Flavobacteriaceae bacterium]